jgi:hypothetical protein
MTKIKLNLKKENLNSPRLIPPGKGSRKVNKGHFSSTSGRKEQK